MMRRSCVPAAGASRPEDIGYEDWIAEACASDQGRKVVELVG
jgi:hypothetical protein